MLSSCNLTVCHSLESRTMMVFRGQQKKLQLLTNYLNDLTRKATDLLVQGMTVVAGRCSNVMTKTDLKTQQKDQGRLNEKRTQLLMENSQERSVLIFIVGFFSLIFAIILLCFCLFTLYNCFYGRMMRKHSERKDSEQTQSTDIEINGQLLQSAGNNEELLPFRHETRTTETTGL